MDPWTCDAARVARWREIDKERRATGWTPEAYIPAPLPPAPVERFRPKKGVAFEMVARAPMASVLRGVRAL